jgi:hypothetical protein
MGCHIPRARDAVTSTTRWSDKWWHHLKDLTVVSNRLEHGQFRTHEAMIELD